MNSQKRYVWNLYSTKEKAISYPNPIESQQPQATLKIPAHKTH